MSTPGGRQMPMALDTGSAPGWYGKLSTLGDFVSRRLEPDWIHACDEWLVEVEGAVAAHARGALLAQGDGDGLLLPRRHGHLGAQPGQFATAVEPGQAAAQHEDACERRHQRQACQHSGEDESSTHQPAPHRLAFPTGIPALSR